MINAFIIICAYLIGSIPSALWIGKIFYKTDIRQHGSGNLGTTNTFRVLGKKPGIAVLLIDILKGNFLNRDEVKIHYRYFVLVFFLLMIMIYSNHLVSKKIEQVNILKEQTEEFKYRNAYAQSKLIKVKLDSELGKEMVQDSLLSLENHPHKILIKLDSLDGSTK